MSMAQVIKFDTLARFTPTVMRGPDEQRGKVIPFMPQPEVPDELVCAAHEELDSESSLTAWLYPSKPLLHLHIRVQHTVVDQGTNTHRSRSGAATGY